MSPYDPVANVNFICLDNFMTILECVVMVNKWMKPLLECIDSQVWSFLYIHDAK